MASKAPLWSAVGAFAGLLFWIYDHDFFLNAGGADARISLSLLNLTRLQDAPAMIFVLLPLLGNVDDTGRFTPRGTRFLVLSHSSAMICRSKLDDSAAHHCSICRKVLEPTLLTEHAEWCRGSSYWHPSKFGSEFAWYRAGRCQIGGMCS